MRKIFIFLTLFSFLFSKSISINDLIKYYKNKEYKKVCQYGLKLYNRFKKDENLVSMYGFSCLKSDYIDRLAVVAVTLKYSKEARANAAYFSTILNQKKLLIHSLVDNVDISNLVLPNTDYILSKIFDMYVQKKYNKKDGVLIFEDPIDKEIKYHLILKKDEKPVKIEILKLKNNNIIETHKYW